MILREPGSKTRHRVERACAQQGVQMHCVMEINSREAILHAVANGMGVGFVTQIECIPLPGLKMVEIDDDELSISYSLCCLAVRKDRPLIRALFEVAQQGDDTAG